YRKNFIRWIESAKREETRAGRIQEMIKLLKAEKKQKMIILMTGRSRLRQRSSQYLMSAAICLLAIFGGACSKSDKSTPQRDKGSAPMKIKLSSPSFSEGQPIPSKYTCDGEDVSPALSWGEAPDGTQSFALICDDPDAPAGTWVHWVMYDLPATTRELSE